MPSNAQKKETTKINTDQNTSKKEGDKKDEMNHSPDIKSHLFDEIIKILDELPARDILTQQMEKFHLHPLVMASSLGHTVGIQKLLSAGVSVNQQDSSEGSTGLHTAAAANHAMTIELLLNHGANPAIVNNEGNNPLMVAISKLKTQAVNALWTHRTKFDINQRNKGGQTVLHLAAEKNWNNSMDTLLNGGVKADIRCNEGKTALMVCASKGSVPCVKALLDHDANISIENNKLQGIFGHMTAVCCAVMESKNDVAKLLVEKLVDSNNIVSFIKNRLDILKKLDCEDEDHWVYFDTALLPTIYAIWRNQKARKYLQTHNFCKPLIDMGNMYLTMSPNITDDELLEDIFYYLRQFMIIPESGKISDKIAQMFVSSHGPNLVLKVLNKYGTWKDSVIEFFYLTPLIPLGLTEVGKSWLLDNYHNILSIAGSKLTIEDLGEMEEVRGTTNDELIKLELLWKKFKQVFYSIQTSQSCKHFKQLLATEKAEKEAAKRKKQKQDKQKIRKHNPKEEMEYNKKEEINFRSNENRTPESEVNLGTCENGIQFGFDYSYIPDYSLNVNQHFEKVVTKKGKKKKRKSQDTSTVDVRFIPGLTYQDPNPNNLNMMKQTKCSEKASSTKQVENIFDKQVNMLHDALRAKPPLPDDSLQNEHQQMPCLVTMDAETTVFSTELKSTKKEKENTDCKNTKNVTIHKNLAENSQKEMDAMKLKQKKAWQTSTDTGCSYIKNHKVGQKNKHQVLEGLRSNICSKLNTINPELKNKEFKSTDSAIKKTVAENCLEVDTMISEQKKKNAWQTRPKVKEVKKEEQYESNKTETISCQISEHTVISDDTINTANKKNKISVAKDDIEITKQCNTANKREVHTLEGNCEKEKGLSGHTNLVSAEDKMELEGECSKLYWHLLTIKNKNSDDCTRYNVQLCEEQLHNCLSYLNIKVSSFSKEQTNERKKKKKKTTKKSSTSKVNSKNAQSTADCEALNELHDQLNRIHTKLSAIHCKQNDTSGDNSICDEVNSQLHKAPNKDVSYCIDNNTSSCHMDFRASHIEALNCKDNKTFDTEQRNLTPSDNEASCCTNISASVITCDMEPADLKNSPELNPSCERGKIRNTKNVLNYNKGNCSTGITIEEYTKPYISNNIKESGTEINDMPCIQTLPKYSKTNPNSSDREKNAADCNKECWQKYYTTSLFNFDSPEFFQDVENNSFFCSSLEDPPQMELTEDMKKGIEVKREKNISSDLSFSYLWHLNHNFYNVDLSDLGYRDILNEKNIERKAQLICERFNLTQSGSILDFLKQDHCGLFSAEELWPCKEKPDLIPDAYILPKSVDDGGSAFDHDHDPLLDEHPEYTKYNCWLRKTYLEDNSGFLDAADDFTKLLYLQRSQVQTTTNMKPLYYEYDMQWNPFEQAILNQAIKDKFGNIVDLSNKSVKEQLQTLINKQTGNTNSYTGSCPKSKITENDISDLSVLLERNFRDGLHGVSKPQMSPIMRTKMIKEDKQNISDTANNYTYTPTGGKNYVSKLDKGNKYLETSFSESVKIHEKPRVPMNNRQSVTKNKHIKLEDNVKPEDNVKVKQQGISQQIKNKKNHQPAYVNNTTDLSTVGYDLECSDMLSAVLSFMIPSILDICEPPGSLLQLPQWSKWKKILDQFFKLLQAFTLQIRHIIIPKYVEKFKVGTGLGGSIVYVGRTTQSEVVAVKKIQRAYFNENSRQTDRITNLSHPNILAVLCIIEDSTNTYIVTPLCECNLYVYLHNLGSSTEQQKSQISIKLCKQLLMGLAFLHTQHMCHGNLKPENVLIDCYGILRLADYGLWKIKSLSRNSSQWRATDNMSNDFSVRESCSADIQVAGMLIYYIMTNGEHPYGERKYEIETNMTRFHPKLRPISPEVDDLVQSLIVRDPSKRPSATATLCHPLFMNESQKSMFVQNVATYVSQMCQSCSRNVDKDLICQLQSIPLVNINGNEWKKRVPFTLLADFYELRGKMEFDDGILGFLEFVYSLGVCQDLIPENTLQDVFHTFSNVCIEMYKVMRSMFPAVMSSIQFLLLL